MSCSSTPTATQFQTVISNSTFTSFSEVVTVLPPSPSTTGTGICTTFVNGSTSCPSSFGLERTSTVQVPFQVTSLITSLVPTATLFETSCPTASSSRRRVKTSVGAIVGEAIAGLVVVALIVGCCFYACRRRRRQRALPVHEVETQADDRKDTIEPPEPKFD